MFANTRPIRDHPLPPNLRSGAMVGEFAQAKSERGALVRAENCRFFRASIRSWEGNQVGHVGTAVSGAGFRNFLRGAARGIPSGRW